MCYGKCMSEAINFDTHKFVKRLVANGFTEQQAETLADEQITMINSNLVTKQDMETFRIEMQKEMETFRIEMQKEMETFRMEMQKEMEALRHDTTKSRMQTIIWVIGLFVAQTGILVSIIKF